MGADANSYPFPHASEKVIEEEAAYLGLDRPAAQAGSGKAPWALCLSGGGIRSATFSLGVLQGLAQRGLLSKFHYLSTVSGGGYIGGWLTRWIRVEEERQIRDRIESADPAAGAVPPDPVAAVESALAGGGPGTGYREPDPLRRLRGYSNYLSPVWGPSTDFFTLVSIFLRNLLLNWAVLLPLVCTLLLLPRIYLGVAALPHEPEWIGDGLAWIGNGLVAIACALVILGIAYVVADLPSEERLPEASAYVMQDEFVRRCFLPVFSAALLLGLAVHWETTWLRQRRELEIFMLAGMFIHLAGCIVGRSMRARRGLPVEPLAGSASLVEGALIALSGGAGGLLVGGYAHWLASVRDPELLLASAVFAAPALLGVFWLATTVYIAVSRSTSGESAREWWSRSGGWWLRAALGWAALFVLVVYLPRWVLHIPGLSPGWLAAGGGIWGLLVSLAGYWTRNGKKVSDKVKGLWNRMGTKLLELAALLFILALLVVLAIAADRLADQVQAKLDHRPVTTLRAETLAEIEEVAGIVETSARAVEAQARHLPDAASAQAALDMTEQAARRLAQLAQDVPEADEPALKGAQAAVRAADAVSRADEAIRKIHAKGNEQLTAALASVTTAANRMAAAALDESARTRYGAGFAKADEALYAALVIALAFAGLGGLASLGVGINTFSLHGMYGNRLVRAYFGTVRGPARRPHWFTGLDPDDNMPMACAGQPNSRPRRLFPVVNLALNLVSASPQRLHWQQRKAASFVVTPLHTGSDALGYLSSREYAGRAKDAISLGRAMTISGAAASSNMGYHSSAPVAFVMTFFNARLGWWLPNPGEHGTAVWLTSEPRGALLPLFWEAFGLTTHDKPYVYVSDGGHFDNMGLYEMVRRRCKRILLVDASADAGRGFSDLEDVLRKIRIDLDVDIELSTDVLEKDKCYGVGRIGYARTDPGGEDGYLYYVKPTLCGALPLDVWNYALDSRRRDGESAFPHQSTADQFFDERQFESYRMLGLCTVDMLLGPALDAPRWPRFKPVPGGARVASATRSTDVRDGVASAPAADDPRVAAGVISGLAGASQSLGQGALLAAAFTVGGAVGVTGSVALQESAVAVKPGGEVTLAVPSGLQVPVSVTAAPLDPELQSELRKALNDIASAARDLANLREAQGKLNDNVVRVLTHASNIEKQLASRPGIGPVSVTLGKEERDLFVDMSKKLAALKVANPDVTALEHQLGRMGDTLQKIEQGVTRVTPPRNVRGTGGEAR